MPDQRSRYSVTIRYLIHHDQHAGHRFARCPNSPLRVKIRLYNQSYFGRHWSGARACRQRRCGRGARSCAQSGKAICSRGQAAEPPSGHVQRFCYHRAERRPGQYQVNENGPRSDPEIAHSQSRFVSRGDNSGTHTLEKALWEAARVTPQGAWYIEAGQGMAATLGIANERNASTITDRGTYLPLKHRLALPIHLEGDRALLNIYSVMEVNRANGQRINAAGGKAVTDFMVSPQAQAMIKSYGVEKFGQPLFVPVAGKREEDLGV